MHHGSLECSVAEYIRYSTYSFDVMYETLCDVYIHDGRVAKNINNLGYSLNFAAYETPHVAEVSYDSNNWHTSVLNIPKEY